MVPAGTRLGNDPKARATGLEAILERLFSRPGPRTDKIVLVRLHRLLLLLLLLPGLALGPGWNLRICAQRFLVMPGCCEAKESCCTDEGGTPEKPVAESEGRCDRCCIGIETQGEHPLQGAEPLGEQLERAQVVARVVVIAELAPRVPARPAPSPDPRPPSPPGRCTPLPLRI